VYFLAHPAITTFLQGRSMKNLIIGNVQIGSALFDVLKDHHTTHIRDISELDCGSVSVLNICFPDSDQFVDYVKKYINQYKPDLTIIHSSISVGKTELCGDHVVYSPVRGRHPKLSKDLKIYDKFVFSKSKEDLKFAFRFLSKAGLVVRVIEASPNSGEMLKLISNIHMGLEIAWRQELARLFKNIEMTDFLYREWEETYREGYLKSGDEDLIRPIMKPDPIGGHCIIPCTEILMKQFPSKILNFIIQSNEKRKEEINGMA